MAADDMGTLAQLKLHRRELIEPKAAQYHGRVVKLMGDGTLMEFGSVVDAVLFAVEVQRAMAERNAAIAEDRRITYRVGINIGDIIVDGDDIYGDGVNVAARLEGLADPGTVYVSGSVFNQVKGKVDLGFEDLGEHTVKNIPEPIQVFRVLLDPDAAGKTCGRTPRSSRQRRWLAVAGGGVALLAIAGAVVWTQPWTPDRKPAAADGTAVALADKPSIAVLPFDNLSGDPQQEYFVDGMTDDLITDLSRISGLFVIARNSVYTYRGRTVKVREVSQELGVRYVLEGSVRKAGTRLRINTQLSDATTGGHIWAERFDRDLDDVFALQDEVVGKIVAALRVRLTEGERRSLARPYTNSVEAYDIYLRGLREFVQRSKEGNGNARALYEKAIALDPSFARAYAGLAWAHNRDFLNAWTETPETSLEQGMAFVNKAIALDDSLPLAHFVMGQVQLYHRNHEKSLAALTKALALDPNYADAYVVQGVVLNFAGRPDAALEAVNTAMRLNPHQPLAYLFILGSVYFCLDRQEDAVDALKRALARNPSAQRPHMWLAATYARLGLMEDAEWEAEELLTLDPNFSLTRISEALPFKDPAHLARLIDSLRKAGLPE
jgi:TolB-like protein